MLASATGIVGGSYAAALMSWYGSVPAGGMVATLQSIGAAGLRWTGMTTAATAGGVTGVGVAGAVQQRSNDGDSQAVKAEVSVSNNEGRVTASNRPFVNWRNW